MNAGFIIDGVSYPVVTHAASNTSYSANDTYSLTTYVNNGVKITGYVGVAEASAGATTNASGSVSVSLVTSS